MTAVTRAVVALAVLAVMRWLVSRDKGLTWGVEFGGHVAPLHRAADDDDDGGDAVKEPDPLEPYRRGMDGEP